MKKITMLDVANKERSYIEMLMAKQVDGLIIFPTSGNVILYNSLKKSQFPIVFVDRKMEPCIYPTFMLDNERAAYLAVNQLIQSRRKNIGLVSTSIERGISPRVERLEGFKNTLKKNGLLINDKWIITANRHEIFRKLEMMWRNEEHPDAFFAANDLSLIELLKFFKSKNIHIPENVSVTAVDDSPFLEISTPPITVIS